MSNGTSSLGALNELLDADYDKVETKEANKKETSKKIQQLPNDDEDEEIDVEDSDDDEEEYEDNGGDDDEDEDKDKSYTESPPKKLHTPRKIANIQQVHKICT